jgi:hypothetical protein
MDLILWQISRAIRQQLLKSFYGYILLKSSKTRIQIFFTADKNVVVLHSY